MSKAKHLAPHWKRLALTGASAAMGVIAMHAPAQAAVMVTPLAVAATNMLAADCARASTFAPAATGITADGLSMSKSEAILGGAISALDRIRAEQAGLQLPQLAMASARPSTLTEISNVARCANTALAIPTLVLPSLPGLADTPAADSFLATPRIAIRQTAFSEKWKRVSTENLTQGQVSALTGISPEAGAARIQFVNRWVNQSITYGEDRDVWAARDYWATAQETLNLRRGDCEDLAILKYQMLLALGVNPQDMYLTLARDLARNADHAMLIVHLDDRFYMLDNSTDAILPANLSYDYRPTLSFNSQSAWLHGAVSRPRTQTAYLSVSAISSPRVMGLSR